jgi:hypothetical protein
MSNLTTDTSFIKPYFIEELGEEGLTSHDVAKSLQISVKHVHERIKRSFEEDCKNIPSWRLVAVATTIDSGTYAERQGISYLLNTAAAKAFVATYRNKIGLSYLNYLFGCEAIVHKEIPLLRAQLDTMAKQLQQARLLLDSTKKPHHNKGTMLVPTMINTLYGEEVEYRRVPKDRPVPNLTRMEGEVKQLTTLAKGMIAKIDRLSTEIAKERRR